MKVAIAGDKLGELLGIAKKSGVDVPRLTQNRATERRVWSTEGHACGWVLGSLDN